PAAFVMQQALGAAPSEPPPKSVASGPAPWSGILTDNLPTLRRRAQGAYVRLLQRLMVMAGLDPGSIDGIFGAKTEAAVKAYQKRYGLVVDGVVGQKTWGQLAK